MTTADSAEIANIVARPPVHNPVGLLGGRVRCAMGNFEAATTDLDVADIFRLTRLPTNARVMEIKLGADNLGTTCTVDIGIYQTDGTVLDADEFGSAVILDSAVFEVSTVIMYESAATDIVRHGDRLWERAGLSTDPGGQYDICLTVAAATTVAAGTIAYSIYYVID